MFNLTPDQTKLVIEAVGFPLIFFALNIILRRHVQQPLTAGTDGYMLIIPLDLTAVLQYDLVSPLIPSPYVKQIGPHLLLFIALLAVVLWAFSILVVEKRLSNAQTNQQTVISALILFLGWFVVGLAVILNYLIFTWS